MVLSFYCHPWKLRKQVAQFVYIEIENLNDYFKLYVCVSFHMYVCMDVTHSFFSILAIVSQNVNNESCLACVKSERYVIWVTLRPLGSMRQGEAELPTLQNQVLYLPNKRVRPFINFGKKSTLDTFIRVCPFINF